MNTSTISTENNKKGMPSGIPFIIGNEAAERFSFYGMKAILTIFMVNHLNMSDSTATEWYHNFNSAVYFLPLLGALLSDLFIGKYKTILYLSILYCFGHLVLALNETQDGLFWGLILISLGAGGIKPCVSSHVGDQFGEGNKHLVSKVFNYFYFAVNFGSFLAYLSIEKLLNNFGPEVAFGLPGVLMLLATIVFWIGRHSFVHVKPKPKEIIKEISSPSFWKLILRLGIIYLFISVFWALFDQTGSAWLLQASSDLMDKSFTFLYWDFHILPSEIQAANPAIVMVLVPLFTFLIYPKVGKKLTPLMKICIGMMFGALSFFVVAFAENSIYIGQSTSFWWQVLAYVLLTIGEVMVSITALEYAYTQSPNSVKSIIMSFYLLSVSLGNQITSAVNRYMIEDLEVQKTELNEGLVLTISEDLGVQSGDKVNINKNFGLIEDNGAEKADTLKGTYLLGKLENNKYVVWNTNREPVKIKMGNDFRVEKMQMDSSAFSYYKLNGSDYFNFFAWMMLITSILFIPFVFILKDKTYFQGE